MDLAVRPTYRAIADLDEIRSDLFDRNLTGAERVRKSIDSTIAALTRMPQMGRPMGSANVHPYMLSYTQGGFHVNITAMIKALELAIEKLKGLPDEHQAYAAEVIEEMVSPDAAVFDIPADHRPGVLEGLAQMRRGEFASDEEMAALWEQCGL